MMLEFAGAGKAMFGAFAIIFPALITGFGIVIALLFGWRLWFGAPKQDVPPEEPSPRRPSNDNKRH